MASADSIVVLPHDEKCEAAIAQERFEVDLYFDNLMEKFPFAIVGLLGICGAVVLALGAGAYAARESWKQHEMREAFAVGNGQITCTSGQNFTIQDIPPAQRKSRELYTRNPQNDCSLK